MLMNNSELKSKINQLWDKFWSGGIANPLTAIEQITYLLFMKRLDDLEQKNIADAEFTGEKYISKFEGYWVPPEHFYRLDDSKPLEEAQKEKDGKEAPYRIERKTLRWSEFRRWPAEEMLTHVQSKVFPFLKELNGGTSHLQNT